MLALQSVIRTINTARRAIKNICLDIRKADAFIKTISDAIKNISFP